MEKFNVGDWVYGSDWCYGCITEIEDGFAVVEYETDRGGGNCSFVLEDLKKAEAPKRNTLKTLPQYHFDRDDFREFLVELRKDLVWNGIIKDEALKNKMEIEQYD